MAIAIAFSAARPQIIWDADAPSIAFSFARPKIIFDLVPVEQVYLMSSDGKWIITSDGKKIRIS